MPRTQQDDAWAEERRAAGMTEDEIAYMRSSGRTEIQGNDDQNQGDDQGTGSQQDGQQQGDPPPSDQTQQTQEQDDEDDDVTLNQPVPYQRFQRERKKLRARLQTRDQELNSTRGQLNELQTRMTRLDERLRVFREAAEEADSQNQGQQQQEEEAPDADQDPIGYIKWLGKQLQQGQERVQQVNERVQTRESMEGIQQAYMSDARQYASTQAAFPEAYQWLIQLRNNQLIEAGIDDPKERERMIVQDERDLVVRAFTDRQSNPSARGPAERLYRYAVASGFKPGALQSRQQNNGQGRQQTNGQDRQQQNNSRQQGRPSVGDQIDSIERGRAASRSLSGTGGATPRGGLNVEQLLEMSDDEYGQFIRDMTPAQRREYQNLLGAPERRSLR